jgi:NAD(P)-dependent dehydrogenase (short-subunit alcohol dehydrogenase family)
VIEAIKKTNPSIEVAFVEIDLLNNKSVQQAADKIKALTDKIHVLINNAGVMVVRNYVTSVDGVESQFAANYLVQVGSLGYQLEEINLDDINFQVSALRVRTCKNAVNVETDPTIQLGWKEIQSMGRLWTSQDGRDTLQYRSQ